jgi:hypothetical protein
MQATKFDRLDPLVSASSLLRALRPALIVAIAAAALLVVAAASTRSALETYPVADTATTSISTLQAARGTLAVGSYSRFGWNHPGPLLYQLLAGPYELSGRREIALKWTALAINLVSLAGVLLIAGRRAPALAAAIAVALVPLLWREQRLLFSAWNPFVPVLALACGIAAAADLASGAGWRSRLGLTWLVATLSFCVQAHAGLIVPAAVSTLAAAVGLRRAAGPVGAASSSATWHAVRRGLWPAACVAAALWAVPFIAEVRHWPGNLAAMGAFLVDGTHSRGGWSRAAAGAAYMTLGPILPSWVVLYDEVPHTLPAWVLWIFVLLVAAVAVAAVRAHRRGRPFEAAFAGISALTSVAVVVAARGVVGPLSDYLLLWATAVGALDLAVIGAACGSAIAAARAPQVSFPRAAAFVRAGGLAGVCVLAWAVIGGMRLVGKHAEQARDTTVRALSADLQAYCRARAIARPLLAFGGETAWQEAAGIVLQFDKADRPIAVEDSALYLVGRPFARTGREDATFYLMPVANATLPANAGRTEWVTTRGAYRIVRLRTSGTG